MPWKAPHYRKSYKKKYGSKCFLVPKENKYPICYKGKPNCLGIRAADFYINMHKKNSKYKSLKRKIEHFKHKFCTKTRKT
jgi:hypothetical protein